MARVTGIVFEVKDAATGQMKKIESEFVSATTKMGNSSSQSSKKIADGNKDLVSSLTKVYFQVQILESIFTKFFQVPIAGFKTVTEEALKFEKSIAQISTLVDSAQIPTKQLNKEVSETAIAFGQDKIKTASAYYEILSSGAVSASEANKLLGVASKMAVAGGTEVDTAMGGLTTTMAAYGLSADKANDVSDAFFAAAAAGKTNIKELSHFIGESAAVASQAGVGYDELLAAIAAGSTTLGSTRFAVTGLNQAIQHILAPTESAKKEAKRLGIEFSAAGIQAKGLRQYLIDLVNAPNMTAASMKKLFESIEAVKLVSAITANEGQKFAETLEVVENRAGKTTEAFDKMAKTSEFLFQKMNTSFSITQSKLGSLITETEVYKGTLKGLEEISGAIQVLVEKYMPEDATAFGIEKVANAVIKLTISINNFSIVFIEAFLPIARLIDTITVLFRYFDAIVSKLPAPIAKWLTGFGEPLVIIEKALKSFGLQVDTSGMASALMSGQRLAKEFNIQLESIIANRQIMSNAPDEGELFSPEFVGPPAPKDKEKAFGSSESTKKGKKEKSWDTIFEEAGLAHMGKWQKEYDKVWNHRVDMENEFMRMAIESRLELVEINEKALKEENAAIDRHFAEASESYTKHREKMFNKIQEDKEAMKANAVAIADAFGSSIGSAIMEMIKGQKTFTQVFQSFLDTLLQQLLSFLASEIIFLFLNIISGGGLGSFIGATIGKGFLGQALGFTGQNVVSNAVPLPFLSNVAGLSPQTNFMASSSQSLRTSTPSNSVTRNNNVTNIVNISAPLPVTRTDFDRYMGENVTPSLRRVSSRRLIRRS